MPSTALTQKTAAYRLEGPDPVQAPASLRGRVGVGEWTYEPWRNNFFPAGLPRRQELEYASRRLRAIEVNGTITAP